jgi:beta-N-acetylhexosaminidase
MPIASSPPSAPSAPSASPSASTAALASLCGPLVIGGFSGTSLPAEYERALREERRGGAIVFSPNVAEGAAQTAALARQVHSASRSAPSGLAPLLGIDQEGGRVVRLRAPFLAVPPMANVAAWRDAAFAERIARAMGTELAALGVTIDFAPVLDVNTCPHNPIIGDRAFGDDPDVCATFGAAWIRGLQSAGVLSTGKHFPGHGDTSKDSHLELPVVDQPRERLERVELVPFRAAVQAGVAALMTAHVVYPALDPDRPATLSHVICTELRERIGFRGILVSDDLEMRAISAHGSIGDAAVLAVAAGCDALLVCHSFEAQEAAVEALVREASRSPAFRDRCKSAGARVTEGRRRMGQGPLADEAVRAVVGGPESRAVAEAMARMWSIQSPS